MAKSSSSAGRIVFDLSTLGRWSGPPVGIIRVEREYAAFGRACRGDVAFSFFDPTRQVFRQIRSRWVDPILNGEAAVDTNGLPEPRKSRRHRSEHIPAALRPALAWVLQSRRQTVLALERLRITGGDGRIGKWAAALQRPLLTQKYRKHLFHPDGRRRALVPFEMALGPRLSLGPTDTLISAGAGWVHTNIDRIRELKQTGKFRFVLSCQDVMPLLFPHFFDDQDVVPFREYHHAAFPIADLVIFSAKRNELDARTYCAVNGIALGTACVVGLGADPPRIAGTAPLPSGLTPGRYALFVSTIEPRKGHRMLLRVWRRLFAEGVPQAAGFKLVFVGRPGWLVGELMDELRNNGAVGETLQVLSGIDDATLATLYEAAAFCLYPSLYEGYGLPIVEAFAHGKAVIASSGGAIPEVVGDLAPCLDPTDEDAWHAMIKRWVEKQNEPAAYAAAVKTRFTPRPWKTAATDFFGAIDDHAVRGFASD